MTVRFKVSIFLTSGNAAAGSDLVRKRAIDNLVVHPLDPGCDGDGLSLARGGQLWA